MATPPFVLLKKSPLEAVRNPASWRAATNFTAVATLTGFVKIAGALKTAISAQVFGFSNELDAYLIAFLLPSFVCDVLAGGLTPALVPVFVKLRATAGADYLKRHFGRTLYLSILSLSIIGALTVGLSGSLFKVLATGFPPDKLRLTTRLLLVMTPMFPLTGIAAVWRSLLNCEDRFGISAISPVMTPAAAILFMLLGARFWGIFALALGTAVGGFAEVAILAMGLVRARIPILPRWGEPFVGAQWLRTEYLPITASNVMASGTGLVDQAMAGSLGVGAVSLLNLGTRVAAVLLAIGPAALSTILLPTLCRLSFDRAWKTLRSTVRKYIWASVIATGALTCALVAFSDDLARLAFRHGGRNGIDIHLLASVQAFSFLQLPFAAGSVTLVRLLVSLKLSRHLVVVSLIALLLNGAADLALIHVMGISGISAATSVVQAVSFAVLLMLTLKGLRQKESTSVEHEAVYTMFTTPSQK